MKDIMAELLKASGNSGVISLAPVNTNPSYKGYNIVIVTDKNNVPSTIGTFWLNQFPSCCGMCVLHAVQTWYPLKGVGTLLHKLAEYIAYEDGFTVLVSAARLDAQYVHEQKILEREGHTKVKEFINSRTDNPIGIFYKHLHTGPSIKKSCIVDKSYLYNKETGTRLYSIGK